MMKFVILLVFICYAYAEDVIQCTDSNFEATLKASSISLVKFYAPWCGHCKKMAPEFETAATALKQYDPPVSLIKVDCTTEKDACSKYGVSGYPTLKIFRGLEAEDYNGGRTAAEMIKLMKAKAGPSSKILESVDTADAYFDKRQDVVIVGYFPSEDTLLAKAHLKVANSLSSDYKFAHSTSADVLKKFDVTDTVVLYRNKKHANMFEPSEVVYDGEKDADALKAWIKATANGLCGHRTASDTDDFPLPLVAVYYKADYIKDHKGTNYWRNRVLKVASQMKKANKIVTFSINNNADMAGEMAEFGLKDDDVKKPLVGMWDGEKKKYNMKEEFSVAALGAFVTSVLDGTAEVHMKSEELPTGTDEGVQVVVAKNFEEVVNDNTKDVLIEFYAPWCGHCKTLAPKYVELAKKMADEDDVVIAKMDATANDVPSAYNVQGFPTIFFAPKGGKSSPQQYSGAREVDDFVKFLAEKSTDGLKGYDRNGKPKKKEL